MTKAELQQVSEMVIAQTMFLQKDVMNAQEAAMYLGISMHTLNKLTCYKKIPYYRPMNGLRYFNRQELNEWMMSDRYKY